MNIFKMILRGLFNFSLSMIFLATTSFALDKHSALIIVDVQNDFLPGGALAVPHGEEVIAPLLTYAEDVARAGGLIAVTKDLHPPGHYSFSSSGMGGIWPDHCVWCTPGAELHPDLEAGLLRILVQYHARIVYVYKGYQKNEEAYSGFQDTDLAKKLRTEGIKSVLVGGLATDYCVKATALDAVKEKFKVTLLSDAARGVDVKPGDVKAAIQEMKTAGVSICQAAIAMI